MKILKILLLTLSTTISNLAEADIIGVKGDLSYWDYDSKVNMLSQTSAPDLESDPKGSIQLSFAFEHPIPLIPNAKIRYVNLKSQTKSEILAQPVYDLNIDHTDLILYYEFLDLIVSADAGLGVTNLHGEVTTLGLNKTDIDKTIPVIYILAGMKLPFTGLSSNTELLYSNYDNTQITDALAELQYNFIDTLLVDIGLKAGYRFLEIKLDNYDKNDLKFNFKGPYLGLNIHF